MNAYSCELCGLPGEVEAEAQLNRLQASGLTNTKQYTAALAAQLNAQTSLARAVAETRKLQAAQPPQPTAGGGAFAGAGLGALLSRRGVAPLAGIAGVTLSLHDAAKQGIAFQDAMNVVQASLNATNADMAKLSDLAQRLGNDLTLPSVSAADAGVAMTELAKAGLTLDNVLKGTKGTLQLAAAGNLSVAEAATITADALNAFELSGGRAAQVANVLSNAASSSSGEVVDFGMGLQQVAAVAHGANLSIEETVTLLAELAKNGIKGSDAGTSLKTAILRLQAPIGEGAATIRELGLQTRDAAGNMLPARKIIENLTVVMRKLDPATRDAALSAIFGQDAIRAGRVILAEGTKGYDEYTAAIRRAGGAEELAAARAKGLGGALRGLSSTAETVELNAFKEFAPEAEELAKSLTKLVQDAEPLAVALGKVLGLTLKLANVFASHEPLVVALAGLYGTRLAGGIGKAAGGLERITGSGAAKSLDGLSGSGGRLAGTLKNIDKAALGARLGIVAVFTEAVTLLSKYNQGGRQAEDFRTKLLGNDSSSEAALAKSVTQLKNFRDAQIEAMGGSSKLGTAVSVFTGEFLRADRVLEDTWGLMDEVWAKADAVNQNIADIATATGLPAARIRQLAEAAGVDLAGGVDEATRKLVGFYNTTVAASPATQALAGSLTSMGDSAQSASEKADALKTALDALIGVHLTADAAADKYQDALDKLASTLKANKGNLDNTTEAGRAGKAAIRDLITSTLDLRDARAREGATTEQQRRILQQGRAELIRIARHYGITRAELDKYLRRLGDTPQTVRTVLTVQGREKALRTILDVQEALKKLPDHTATRLLIDPVLRPGTAKLPNDPLGVLFPSLKGKAGGGLIDGPGTTTSDSILLRGSRGEYVQRAAAVSYYGLDFMDRLNRLQIPRFAGGGLASSTVVRVDGGTTHSVRHQQDIKGPVIIQGIDFDDAQRQLARKQRDSNWSGGARPG